MPEPHKPGTRHFQVKDEPAPKTQSKPKSDPPPTDGGEEFTKAAKERSEYTKLYRDLAEAVESSYQMVGMVAGMAARDEFQRAAAVHIINQSGVAADAWIDLAEKNPKVKAALQKFVSGTASAQLLTIHLTMFAPLLASHGVIPKNLGVMILGAEGAAAAAAASNGNTP